MEKLYIFKFQDYTDGNYAFIIGKDEPEARSILEQETSLKFIMTGSKFLEEVPDAQRHWEEKKKPIYTNRILPF
jgi:hypothetical protein